MKCTSKIKSLIFFVTITFLLTGCANEDILVEFEKQHYNIALENYELFAKDLITPIDNVLFENYKNSEDIAATALFNLETGELLQSYNILEERAPASTTKIMTAYVALKYGNLEEEVTISANAVNLPSDSQMCGLKEGDIITLYDLLVGLTIHSGNDSAIAIAEHISGTEKEFAKLMTQEANALGATSTNFMNAHGLDEVNHSTTLYDLYLMFNAVINNSNYMDIISDTSFSTMIKGADGTERPVTWVPTNYYHQGHAKSPIGFQVIGGKTGTTSNAKNCLVLLVEDENGTQYISITLGSSTKDHLYEKMTELIELIPQNQ